MKPLRFVPLALLASLCASTSSAQSLIARINAAGPALTDDLGQNWSGDQPYSAGSGGYVGGSTLGILSRRSGFFLGGQDNPLKPVFGTSRVGWTAYRFDVPDGDYIVRLTLAEIWNQGPGLRSMSVDLEGSPFLHDLDLAALLGVQYGGQVSALVHVSDGRLDVEAAPGPGLDPRVDAPILCGIEVWAAPVTFPGPPAVRGLEAKPGYGANLLTWSWEVDPALAGWRIWRTDALPDHHLASPRPGWVQLADIWTSPPRFHDRMASAGRRQYYRIAALDLKGNAGARSAAVSAIAMDGSESELPRYQLTLDPDDQLFIDKNIFTLPDEEVPAIFTYQGSPRPAEVRYRGSSSRYLSKKSWKIKFSPLNAFEGRRELNLKASFLDPGLMRDALAHQLFEAVGRSSFDVRPVHLEVNGVYLGLFNEAEEVDEAWLAARDRDTGGDLFKANSNLTPLASYELAYEKQTNESTGHAELSAFIDFLNAPASPTFVQDLAAIFDLDSFLSYLAVIAWIGDKDSVQRNYYLLQDLSLDRWEILPWDNDLSFGLVPNLLDLPILYGTTAVPGEPRNQLRERVLAEPELLWRFCQKLTELEERFANSTWLAPRMGAASMERRKDAHADPFKFGWESEIPFESDVASLLNFAALRTAIVDPEIAAAQPATPPTALWLNELAAEAQTLFLDEAGEPEDWVELYNAGTTAVDAGGLYLTDDLSVATRWQIPPGTLIPPGAHALVWCDGEPAQGPRHATFELAAAGGELGLFAADGTSLLDFISWNRQYPDRSYGRYRDGGQFFQLLPTPTAGTANTTAGNLPPSLSWVSTTPSVPRSTSPVEVSCLSRDPDGLSAVELHWRAGGGIYATVALAPLGSDRHGATLPPQANGTVVEYYLTSTDSLAATATKPAEGPAGPFRYTVVDPPLSSLKINEILASNATVNQDEAGDFEDWIEIHNTSGGALDLGGMYLSDDLGNSTKWQIPAGTMIAGGGTLLFWADDEPLDGPLHATFKLSAGGEDVALFDTTAFGNALIDGYSYGAQSADVSFGHLPDGGNHDYLLSSPSPAASNLPLPGVFRAYEHQDSSANPVALIPQGPAAIGASAGFDVSNAPGSKPGVFFFGPSPADIFIPNHGYALVSLPPSGSVAFTTTGSGTASIAVSIPNDPGLIGVLVYSQAFVKGGGLSNGLVSRVGP